MNPENPEQLINAVEREAYTKHLIDYIHRGRVGGAYDSEVQADRLYAELISGKPLAKSYVEKIIGQLGNPDDRSSLYH